MSGVWARLRRVLGGAQAQAGEPEVAADGSAAQARASVEQRFMSMEGVVSVGVGRDREGHEAVFVGIARERSKIARALPREVDGVPVIVEEIGEMRAEEESS